MYYRVWVEAKRKKWRNKRTINRVAGWKRETLHTADWSDGHTRSAFLSGCCWKWYRKLVGCMGQNPLKWMTRAQKMQYCFVRGLLRVNYVDRNPCDTSVARPTPKRVLSPHTEITSNEWDAFNVRINGGNWHGFMGMWNFLLCSISAPQIALAHTHINNMVRWFSSVPCDTNCQHERERKIKSECESSGFGPAMREHHTWTLGDDQWLRGYTIWPLDEKESKAVRKATAEQRENQVQKKNVCRILSFKLCVIISHCGRLKFIAMRKNGLNECFERLKHRDWITIDYCEHVCVCAHRWNRSASLM